jgi:NAD(P)H-hydrate epimerase
MTEAGEIRSTPTLPRRDPEGHKGTFGTVTIVGGNAAGLSGGAAQKRVTLMHHRVMIGAPALAANAALRTGAALAALLLPGPILPAALGIAPTAVGTALPVNHRGALIGSDGAALLDEMLAGTDCLAIGPGLGGIDTGSDRVEDGVASLVLRAVNQERVPVVVDADALNHLSRTPALTADLHASAVLTPHPGEYKRLAGSLGIEADPVHKATRPDAAAQLAQRLGCIVALKGPGTIVTDGQRFSVNATGNAALAVGGSGDVLTGMIAACISQFRDSLDLFQATRLAVHLHGLAADRWAQRHGEAGMLPTDLIDEIPAARAALRAQGGAS